MQSLRIGRLPINLCREARTLPCTSVHIRSADVSLTRESRRPTVPCRAVVLVPRGDGSQDHLDAPVEAPKEMRLEDGQYELGRLEEAQLTIALPTVSGKHALLRVDGDTVTVTDLDSTNGTYIDDEELTPLEASTMGVGQEVVFGDMYLAKFAVEKAN